MAPRPKDPPPDRREEILDAALRMFSEKGYSAATNADIAGAAGVTPAALYYYFTSKEELFRAAIEERLTHVRPVLDQLAGNLTAADPLQILTEALRSVADVLTEERTQAVLRIVLAEGPRDADVTRIWEQQLLGMVASLFPYLDQQMELGRIKRMDPRLVMIMLQGPVMAAVILRDLLKIPVMQGISNEMLIDQVTETVLRSLVTTTQ